jgi:hypothetical protein
MENYEEEEDDLEVVEDTGAIEKVKKPHAKKGQPPTDYQLANLAKGREIRKQKFIEKVEEKAKAVIMKKPELVRQVAQSAPPSEPPKKPPKKKAAKSVIVFQDEDSDSSEDEPQQIIIRRKSSKKAKKPSQPQVIQYESESESESEDDYTPPPPAQPQSKIVFRRY